MFKYSVYLILFFLIACVSNDDSKKNIDLINHPITNEFSEDQESVMPIIELDSDVYDFVEIKQGNFIDIEFLVKNIGNAPLLIRQARGSCGCTVPEWPRDPIKAGDSAIINVRFNSEGKKGYQNKKVTLITNAIPSTRVLTIKGNIIL
tara:strand:- start:293 stop:736 length:444 start_codon:yes stop_codon:yes gene_type:complete